MEAVRLIVPPEPELPAAAAADADHEIVRMKGDAPAGPLKGGLRPQDLRRGSSTIPLSAFFAGETPDKKLTVQILRLGDELELLALSAEPGGLRIRPA